MPAHSPPQKPLIAIVGATGTGKSRLAVELALRFNGEVINGDAMQMYAGLPIITNKIPVAETKGVKHHLLGIVGLNQEPWRVGTFVREALGAIKEIRSRGRIPVLVGGTHYYTQSLLFEGGLLQQESFRGPSEDAGSDAGSVARDAGKSRQILEASTEVMLEKVREVDPVMAERWHPKDRRKIRRSLEIWLQTGKPASRFYEEQRQRGETDDGVAALRSDITDIEDDAAPSTHAKLRFPTLLLWLHASSDVLRARLDARVGKMLADGLLAEINTLGAYLDEQAKADTHVDRTRGIWVSIGFKEFEQYYHASQQSHHNAIELSKLKASATEKTQAATRQYAKRQVRWIRIKLLHALSAAGADKNIFVLDGSDLSNWDSAVQQPAMAITAKFLAGEDLPDPSAMSPVARELLLPKRDFDMSQRRDMWVRKTCDACGMTAVTESDWDQHVKSRGHRNTIRARRKKVEGNDEPEGTVLDFDTQPPGDTVDGRRQVVEVH